MEASYNAANQVYDEIMAKNARFKKIYEQWRQFRAEDVLWFRVVENTLDNFMARRLEAWVTQPVGRPPFETPACGVFLRGEVNRFANKALETPLWQGFSLPFGSCATSFPSWPPYAINPAASKGGSRCKTRSRSKNL